MENVIRASLDRIEGDFAVVYSDDDHKFDVSLELVKGAKPGTRLNCISKTIRLSTLKLIKRPLSKLKKEFARNTIGCEKVGI